MPFRPTADWPILKLRAELLRRTREFFHARGFLEVETPILSHDTVVDRHLDPLETTLTGIGPSERLFLQTSPEFAMKRLLASGGPSIYQITRAFRQGERGPRHNPEFTIVEWYELGADYDAGMRLLGELCETLLGRGQAERLTYGDAFRNKIGIDPHTATPPSLAEAAGRLCPNAAAAFAASSTPVDRDAWLDLLLTELIEPTLGTPRPTILCDYPPSQAALAQVRTSSPPVAERYELYVDGLELANGYHELLDPEALAARNVESNRLRATDGKPTLPAESRLLAAMRHGLPPCAGCALGFDRVVMLAAGKRTIEEVIPFPIERA
jgi:elongation factor P--(R)-beta-lysine ligase